MREGRAAVARAVNVADLVRIHAQDRPDDVAVVDVPQGTTLTWSLLDERVDSLANGLSAAGLVAGQRVAFALVNGATLVTTYLAAARAGVVAVPMNPRSATGELVRMLADSSSRLVVADATTAPSVRSAVGGLQDALEGADAQLRRRNPVPVLAVDGVRALPGEHRFDDLAAATDRRVVSPGDRENLAVVLYTSGTSGRPRGAMLSHRALLSNIDQVASIEPAPTRGDDVVLGMLPLFHIYGLNAVLGQVLAQGARIVLVDRFDADQTLRDVAGHAVTNLPLAPPVVAAWAGLPAAAELLSGVRIVLSGAAPLDPDLRRLFVETSGVPVEHGYGLTETAPVVTSTLSSRARAAGRRAEPAGVGGPVPGVEIQVRDAAGSVLLDDPGQIWVRGANLFSGYWPDGRDGPDADGWFATGDIGYRDVDELVLVDRSRELVVVQGFHVYPAEVEQVVLELAGVEAVAVIGQADARTGEQVVAFVQGTGVTAAQVEAHCEQRLARFKRPAVVHVLDELPRGAMGKVRKGMLRGMTRADQGPA